MASAKEYGYFIKGSKLALIEKDTALDNDVNSRDYGPDVTNVRFKSPQSSVTDGIELEYVYSPKYRINSTATADKETATSYETSSGYLRFNGTSFSTESTVDYIVVRGSDRWDGLHKVTGLNTAHYTLSTKFNGSTTVTDTPTIYTDIDVLNDEADELPLSEYLSKAVVYYLKGKLAEDRGDFQLKDLMMREFYRIVEKSDNAKIHTIRRVAPSSAAIR